MLKLNKKLKSKRGVTLAECIVSIAILAIISTMAYQAFSTSFNNIGKKQQAQEGMGTAAEKLQVLDATDTALTVSADTNISIQADYKYSKSASGGFVLVDGVFVTYSSSNPAHSGLQRYSRTAITSTAATINGKYYTYTDENNNEYTVFVADED